MSSWAPVWLGRQAFSYCVRSFRQTDSRKADGGNRAQVTSLQTSLWSWTSIPSHAPVSGPRKGCLGAGSDWMGEDPPQSRGQAAGGSKLNFHTRVHCGCMGWPWVLPALPAPGKCFPSGSSWSGLSLAKAPAPQPAFLTQWGSWTLAASELWGPAPISQPESLRLRGCGHRSEQHSRTRIGIRTQTLRRLAGSVGRACKS